MKKFVSILLVVALVLTASCALAKVKVKKLKEGKYIVGKDIKAGDYTLKCTATDGSKLNGAYDMLGKAFGALGEKELGGLYGALGDMAEEIAGMSVEILGDFGDVLDSYELDKDEEMELTLTEGTALQISSGKCELTPVEAEK